jgi:hypothetical protein
MRYIYYSLPSIQAFTSMLNIIIAVNIGLAFLIVNFTVVAFTNNIPVVLVGQYYFSKKYGYPIKTTDL